MKFNLGTTPPLFKEFMQLDFDFEKFAYEIFEKISNVYQTKPDLALSLSDFFFNNACVLYWQLINQGNKNLARIFLEKMCLLTDNWEKQSDKINHKGTPYYFLTYTYRELGNIDAAFASAFKAIEEDKHNMDPLFGDGTYKNAPAYKYISLKDDKQNYLIDAINELRNFLNNYINDFNKIEQFSLQDIDSKIFQSDKGELEQIGHFLVYNLELISKYKNQITTLPDNDFYRMKNIRDIFNLCLIIDKILQVKYEGVFNQYATDRNMYISDGTVLLFEDRHWIDQLVDDEREKPRLALRTIRPAIPDRLETIIDQLFTNPIQFTIKGKPFNKQMKIILFAYLLRNMGAHEIGKDDTYVKEYSQIIKWLLFAIFIAVNVL